MFSDTAIYICIACQHKKTKQNIKLNISELLNDVCEMARFIRSKKLSVGVLNKITVCVCLRARLLESVTGIGILAVHHTELQWRDWE